MKDGWAVRQGVLITALRRTIMIFALAIPGCAHDGPVSHLDGEGPLSANSGGVEMAAYAPGDPRRGDESEPGDLPWHMSFGAFALCVYEPSVAEIELGAVRWRAGNDAPPLEVEVYLRTFTGKSAPFISRDGHPLDPKPWPGQWSEDIAGTEIVQPCDEAKPGSPDLTELVVVLTADAAGAHIEELMIDYTADGRDYTLIITHEMVLCGDLVEDDWGC